MVGTDSVDVSGGDCVLEVDAEIGEDFFLGCLEEGEEVAG